MAIPDNHLYEYAIVRYVPRVDRGEFINIGLIMMCKRLKWLRGEIYLNEGRICALDPRTNIEMLSSQASIFMRDNVPSKDIPIEERYRWLTAVKSAVLQVSPSHPGVLVPENISQSGKDELIKNLDREFDRLFKDLVL